MPCQRRGGHDVGHLANVGAPATQPANLWSRGALYGQMTIPRRNTMRTTISVLTAALCLSAAPAEFAGSATPAQPSPSQACKQLRLQLGTSTFASTYGTNKNHRNAMGKCVSALTKTAAAAQTSARSQCKAEQADVTFAATHGGKTFDQFYGTNKNGKNAYGTCVSAKASQTVKEDVKSVVAAARTCRDERKADPAAFKAKYGTNRTKANAFGKCVSAAVRQ